MRVLVTGSREWTDVEIIRRALTLLAPADGESVPVIVHGGARGADTIAAQVATELGYHVETHLADWDRYGKSAGMVRNEAMVDAGADLCLAFILDGSRGATHCAQAAHRAGIRVVHYRLYSDRVHTRVS